MEVFSLQNVIKMLEEVTVGERSGEYGGWCKISKSNLFNFGNIDCKTGSWVLL